MGLYSFEPRKGRLKEGTLLFAVFSTLLIIRSYLCIVESNKRKGLPQWLRDALSKKEKEKQKQFEKERAKKPVDDESDEEKAISKGSIDLKPSPIRKVNLCNVLYCESVVNAFLLLSVIISNTFLPPVELIE